MLGRVDMCGHCREPLTLDPSLEGKEFDVSYNRSKPKSARTKNESKLKKRPEHLLSREVPDAFFNSPLQRLKHMSDMFHTLPNDVNSL